MTRETVLRSMTEGAGMDDSIALKTERLFPRLRGWEWVGLVIFLVIGLTLRLGLGVGPRGETLSNKLLDHHSFRQATEAMMARNFARDGIVLQYPKREGYSQWSAIEVNEFPLYPATVAAAYRLLGREHDAIGRAVTILFSLGTGLLCFFILRLYFENSAPWWGLALFMISPLGVYVGRCFLRHPMAFFFQALALLCWLLWLRRPRWDLWGAACLSTAITGLMNFPNLYVGLPMAAALFLSRGSRGFFDRRVWAFAGISLLPPLLWLQHSMKFASVFLATDITGTKQRDLGRFLRLEWVNADFFSNLWEGTHDLLLTPVGLILGVIGLMLGWRSPVCWIVRIWLGAALLYLCVDHYPVYLNRHEYYFVHLLTPAALAVGIAGGWLVGKAAQFRPEHSGLYGTGAAFLFGMGLLIPWQSYHFPLMEKYMVEEYGWIEHWAAAGEKVREITEPDAVMVVDRPEDALIYYCDRPGWVNRNANIQEGQWQTSGGGDYLLITTYKGVHQDAEGNWRNEGFHFDNPPEGDPELGLDPGSPAAPWVRANCPVVFDHLTFQIVDLQPEKHGRPKPSAAPQ